MKNILAFEIISVHLNIPGVGWVLLEQYADPPLTDHTYIPSPHDRYLVEHFRENEYWIYHLDDAHFRLKAKRI